MSRTDVKKPLSLDKFVAEPSGESLYYLYALLVWGALFMALANMGYLRAVGLLVVIWAATFTAIRVVAVLMRGRWSRD